jgi:hypothetical protein
MSSVCLSDPSRALCRFPREVTLSVSRVLAGMVPGKETCKGKKNLARHRCCRLPCAMEHALERVAVRIE